MIASRWDIAQFFERLWWQNYLKGKNRERYLQWKRDYWNRVLNEVFQITGTSHASLFRKGGMTVLDAGCGPAGIFLNLSQHTVHAFDPLLDDYKDDLDFMITNEHTQLFSKAKLESLHSKGLYDYVFCMNCINHVDDIDLCTANLAAALKPDGFLVITVDAHRHPGLKTLLSVVPMDVLHPHQMLLPDYVSLLERYGLEVKGIRLIQPGFIFYHQLLVAQKK